jgi:hypothetical protein
VTTRIPARTEAPSATKSARTAGWAIFFAPIGDGQRRRRGCDGVRLILASLAVLCAVLILRSNSHPEDAITHALSPPPYGIRWLVTLFWIGGSFGTIAFLLVRASLAKRWMVVRDLAASAVGTLIVSGILG